MADSFLSLASLTELLRPVFQSEITDFGPKQIFNEHFFCQWDHRLSGIQAPEIHPTGTASARLCTGRLCSGHGAHNAQTQIYQNYVEV